MKILIIEDEEQMARTISEYLSSLGYLCEFAYSYSQAIEKVETHNYDCILLDIMLPGGSGMQILDTLKEDKKQDGVIIISAKNALEDKIKGLEIGADDYITKPFHLAELAVRIYSLIRRRQFESSNTISQNELFIDLLAKTVTINNVPISLTKKEFELLVYFIGNKNRVISRSTLAEHLSGDIADMLDNHDFIYSHVKNLKKKLLDAGCDNYLKTVYGTGYKWVG